MNWLKENETSKRKLDHIKVCLNEEVEARFKTTGFEEIDLIHQAYPEEDLAEVGLSSTLFGKKLDAPIIICPMTGGHGEGQKLNKTLAGAAQELNIGFSVGSQRAAIEVPELEETYRVRDVAPDVLLFGNLGAMQLNGDYGVDEAKRAIEMIEADGLGIHFNSLQEAIQPEGHAEFKDALKGISKISGELGKPVYIKETGAGITSSVASKFTDAGANAIDVSGAGGTSWAGVEAMREGSSTELGDVFWDWGIPTSVSTAEVAETVDIPVISSGGIRSGLDAAKAIALGADFVGVGLPLFRAAAKDKESVLNWLEEFVRELKVAVFLCGCKDISELQDAQLNISGQVREWFTSRGIDLDKYER